ncbi:MAG: hypothetical protein JW751_00160 [Polyangiaceae bacterium]|nr:hypothetical protein [Polyangiaceae bacterium]
MEAFWRPYVAGSAPVLISFDVRPFFYVLAAGLAVPDYRVNSAAEIPSSEPFQRFREPMGAEELRETRDYADFGAVHAVFLLGRLLHRDVVLKHSTFLGWEDIFNSNIIFIGKTNLNPTIRDALQGRSYRASCCPRASCRLRFRS